MGFKITDEAIDYFKAIDQRRDKGPKFKILFDSYYLCLMVGLHHGRLGAESQLKDASFIDYYPELYRDKAELITGLLIVTEMERRGLEPEDRRSIEKLILDLVDHQSVTRLSPTGMKFLNLYAAGGIQIIKDSITPTSELEAFLLQYQKLLK